MLRFQENIYGGRSRMMFRYVDALCLLPLYMYPKTHIARARHLIYFLYTFSQAANIVLCFKECLSLHYLYRTNNKNYFKHEDEKQLYPSLLYQSSDHSSDCRIRLPFMKNKADLIILNLVTVCAQILTQFDRQIRY